MRYPNQVKGLLKRGAKIDILGQQMHLFKPEVCYAIAAGDDKLKNEKRTREILWPDTFPKLMERMDAPGLPVHFSEITVSAPGDTPGDFEIQAVISANLYRMWFSHASLMGITWWNVVDGCGFRGEPLISGLFTRDMQPKPVFHALNKLINEDWKTKLSVKADDKGEVKFRGFKGRYRLAWKDKSGKTQTAEFYLKNDGDGKF